VCKELTVSITGEELLDIAMVAYPRTGRVYASTEIGQHISLPAFMQPQNVEWNFGKEFFEPFYETSSAPRLAVLDLDQLRLRLEKDLFRFGVTPKPKNYEFLQCKFRLTAADRLGGPVSLVATHLIISMEKGELIEVYPAPFVWAFIHLLSANDSYPSRSPSALRYLPQLKHYPNLSRDISYTRDSANNLSTTLDVPTVNHHGINHHRPYRRHAREAYHRRREARHVLLH